MRVTNLTTVEKDEFYPTPPELIEKMLSDVDWSMIETLLEPEAGKGDLAKGAIKLFFSKSPYKRKGLEVDCIEKDPYLRQILRYNFSSEAVAEQQKRYCELDRMCYSSRSESEQREHKQLNQFLDEFGSGNVRIIHNDFLTYRGQKRYNLILMNPPFNQGDLHLLKALEIQKHGGAIICLLNAETLLNPYSNTRKLLKRELDKYQAQIEYIEMGFSKAERKTDVKIALIKVHIPYQEEKSSLYEKMSRAVEAEDLNYEATELVVGDYIEQLIQSYNKEVAATLELIREYEALKPYMMGHLSDDYPYNKAILTLTIGTDSNYSQLVDTNQYLKVVRLKYWSALLNNKNFTGKLTSNLREKYREMIEKMADYDFTLFNIQTVADEINSEMVAGIKETIINLFDKLSTQHSWYPECNGNVHYWNGWKTNKAHKVNQKVIIPTHGMFSSYSWSKKTFEVSTAYSVISDIEKALNYLDGGLSGEVNLLGILQQAELMGQTRKIKCKYFFVDLYKKGTTHIKFHNTKLLDKLNIYAAQNKMWLPPNYGKATYSEMNSEEKEAVDEFQGEREYSKVMAERSYYLMADSQLLIAAGL